MHEENWFTQAPLPPQHTPSGPRLHHLTLVAANGDEEEETHPQLPAVNLPTTPTPEPLLWRNQNTRWKQAYLTTRQARWKLLSVTQRNGVIVDLIGWLPDHGTTYWCVNLNLAHMLKRRALEDLFHTEQFADILYLCTCQQAGFDPISEPVLLEPEHRATHYHTLSTYETADIICFAYATTFDPDWYHRIPLLPQPRIPSLAQAPSELPFVL